MKIFVAKILIDRLNESTCSVKLFKTIEEAREFAYKEIEKYRANGAGVIKDGDDKVVMCDWDINVVIEVEEHEL